MIQQLVDAYNASRHRSIGIAPADVEKHHEDRIWTRLYKDGDTQLKPPMPRGAMVRISKIKGVFDKKYMPNWSKEHFTVDEAPSPRHENRRRVYKIADYNSEPVNGVWYPEELQQVTDNQYRIERVIKRRKAADGLTELFEKWEGCPDKFNSLIDEADKYNVAPRWVSSYFAKQRNWVGYKQAWRVWNGSGLPVGVTLPGTWEVSVIDNSYPHTWLDLDNECVIGISTVFNNPNNPDTEDIIGEANSMELVKALKHLASYQQ